MKLYEKLTGFFGLNDENWMRHSNPWSVWTRFVSLPLLCLCLASAWKVGWFSLLPTGAILFWLWINPRAFAKPASTRNWASKAVLGERVWLRDGERPVPDHHRSIVRLLGFFTSLGIPLVIWGLAKAEVWPTLFGLTVVVVGKLWFLDRMVWIFEDMKQVSEEYRSWEY